MHIEQRVGIIGGNGWLGGAIAQAALAAGLIKPAQLTLSGRSNKPLAPALAGVEVTQYNQHLVEQAEVIVLSVRPDQFAEVNIDARGKLVISVMAGVPAEYIAARTGASEVVRAIPNAAAALGQSFTPWYATAPVTAQNKALVQALFAVCGEAAEVPEEGFIDYCVGMTGSGAAFPALLAQAMETHAIAQGLPADFARRAALGVVVAASQLLAAPGSDPAAVVQEMIDYKGTTAAALNSMLAQNFSQAVAAGLDAAGAKASAMSRQVTG
ncbi:pyrroline-5-carboxylate reductase dimerization domain-containing protein [Pseudomonas sp. NPDC007930]|uniref:pyrroline-5-carboxylate reductase family protein n=1 Tax=Pseudomonas sp. NPDC007930 TaxID=3364417 RepID=UPI0036F1630E